MSFFLILSKIIFQSSPSLNKQGEKKKPTALAYRRPLTFI